MENRIEHKKICKFCGKERAYYLIIDDGYDYDGHSRGSYESCIDDDGCDCTLGRLEYNKANIRHMCMNCKFYKYGCCTNKDELENVNELFDVGKKVYIKSPTIKCDYYETDYNIFKSLLQQGE